MELNLNLSKVEEISIPVPWGEIRGKQFNKLQESNASSKSNFNKSIPILCFHGWLDNCGTFDKLIPLIHNKHPDLTFIAIDFTGHGKSSHKPNGTYEIDSIKNILDVARIVNHLKLNESGFNVLAHSMGYDILMQYNCIFPNKIKSFIGFDCHGTHLQNTENFKSTLKNHIDGIIRLEESQNTNKKPTGYTFNQAKLKLASTSNIREESAEILLARGLNKVDNCFNEKNEQLYTLSRDVRLRIPYNGFYTLESARKLLIEATKSSRHNHLQILTSENFYLKYFNKSQLSLMLELWGDIYKANRENPNYKLLLVQGGHHVHLCYPERVADSINEWIDSGNCSLASENIEWEQVLDHISDESWFKKE